MALASTTLGEALRLRRGEPLTEFAYAGFADAERTRLDELTLVAIETRVEADLALGRHGELVGELEALCREHPLRERLWELLMLALYRAGRQARPCVPTPKLATAWSTSSASTPARHCENSRPASWPRTRHSPPPAGSSRCSGADGNGQPAGAIEQLRRSRRGTPGAERGGPLEPAGDADRSRRGGQDPAGGRGRRHPARRAPGRGLAGRVRERHRARGGGAGGGRRTRGGRAGLARLRRTRRWSSSCATWPGGRFWSSSTTVNT